MSKPSPPEPGAQYARLAPAEGSRLLVVGGFGGIGMALVEAARDIQLDVSVMDLAAAADRRGMLQDPNFTELDLRDESSIQTGFSLLGSEGRKFDGVALCSGYTRGHDPIKELDTDRFDDILSGNLRGPALALRAMQPLLTDDAAVVVLSTAIGQVGAPGYAGYGAAKAGLNAIVRIAAAEFAPRIRVNAVAPGAVDTAFIRGGYDRGGAEHGPARRFDAEAYRARVPLDRMGVPADIVGPILFLLSPAARYITGQVLHVNGGAFMRD